MAGESVPNPNLPPDVRARVAILQRIAEQERVMLPADVALYIAQNIRSNARALQGALWRLFAHSSVTGSEITLLYTQRVLKNFIDLEVRKVSGDLIRRIPLGKSGTDARIRYQDATAADRPIIFCLLKAQDERKTSRVRNELEVNMRERERGLLARLDAYERALERCAKKRNQA